MLDLLTLDGGNSGELTGRYGGPSVFRQVTHLCMRLLTNWRPRGTQYFCLSCVSVSLTPLWSTCTCTARATSLVKWLFLGSSTGNLDWSSRGTLSNLPWQRRTALSSRYTRLLCLPGESHVPHDFWNCSKQATSTKCCIHQPRCQQQLHG